MDLYFFIYFLFIIFIIFSGFSIKKNLKNISGNYYYYFSLFLGSWFGLYFIFYIISDVKYLLLISKTTFLFSILGLYCFVQFIYNFGINKRNKLQNNNNFFNVTILFLIISYLYLFTDFIISGISYDPSIFLYYEEYGKYIFIHYILTFFLFLLILYLFFDKFKKSAYINKIRLKNIFYGFLFFLFFGVLFQTLLPYFGIYLLQKEIILFIIPFIIITFYTLTKYHFGDPSLRYNEIFSFFLSLFLSSLILYFLKLQSLNYFSKIESFWSVSGDFTFTDLIFSISLFFVLYKFLINIFPGNKDYKNLLNVLNKSKEQIPFFLDLHSLIGYLDKFINKNFNVSYINITLDKNLEILKFFNKSINNDIFINDIVFLEENKNEFDYEILKNEINNESYLILPLKNSHGDIFGIFELGKKPFKEHYYSDEINIIKDYVNFLSIHLKYIDIYSKINYLSINLDKEVDKKTIDFNILINKQKEFISIASHEIKTPIMSSSLQLECILEDLEEGKVPPEKIKEELLILRKQIYKISDLVKTLFNIEKYDIGKTKLYLEKIKLENIFLDEIDFIKKQYNNVSVSFKKHDDIGFIDLDKVQFTQVISNLLNNGVKFSNKINPKISINLYNLGKNIKIVIEDNGDGFKYGEEKYIFDKYNTGKGESIGLGLGLYLCKKITEFHNGSINAYNSSKLSGAKFILIIPKNQERET